MNKYIIKYKEVGSDRIRTTTYEGPHNKEYVIDFFGLNGSDIEWYDVVLEKQISKHTQF